MVAEKEPEIVVKSASPSLKFQKASSLGLITLNFSEKMKSKGSIPTDFCSLELISESKELRIKGENKPTKRRLDEEQ